MPLTLDEVYLQVLALPDEAKELLAERLAAYLETPVEPKMERAHLDEAKRRRDEIRSGRTVPVDGRSVMAQVQQIVGK